MKSKDGLQFEHTIYFFIHRGVRMENTEGVDKFIKLDNTVSLFIKNIKNLEKKMEFNPLVNSWHHWKNHGGLIFLLIEYNCFPHASYQSVS